MDPLFKNKLSWWQLKAKKEKDPWVKFFLYYQIFDSYITKYSGSNTDKGKLKWFVESDNSMKNSLPDSWKTKLLPYAKALQSLSPVHDMRPNPGPDTILNDPENLKEIFDFIYQIRCNLFHGAKDLHDQRDASLVFYGGEFLRTMIDWWILHNYEGV